MCLKRLFRTFILLLAVSVIVNTQETDVNENVAKNTACCAVYFDTLKNVGWFICGQNNNYHRDARNFTLSIIYETSESLACHEVIENDVEPESGNFDLSSKLDWNIPHGSDLKLASRAFSGFSSIKTFSDSDTLSGIEADAFDESSLRSVTFSNVDRPMVRIDDNAFRQRVPTIENITLTDRSGNYVISPRVFKHFTNVKTINFHYRSTTLTCPYLQYATNLQRIVFESEEQKFSSCFLCRASSTVKMCLPETLSFEVVSSLNHLKLNLLDVTIEENNCLVLKPGMNFSQSSVCKTPLCVTECASSSAATTTRVATTSVAKTSVAKTNVATTSVAKTSVAKTSVAKTSVATTRVAKTREATTRVAKTSVATTSVAKTNVAKTNVAKTNVATTSVQTTSRRFTSATLAKILPSVRTTTWKYPITSMMTSTRKRIIMPIKEIIFLVSNEPIRYGYLETSDSNHRTINCEAKSDYSDSISYEVKILHQAPGADIRIVGRRSITFTTPADFVIQCRAKVVIFSEDYFRDTFLIVKGQPPVRLLSNTNEGLIQVLWNHTWSIVPEKAINLTPEILKQNGAVLCRMFGYSEFLNLKSNREISLKELIHSKYLIKFNCSGKENNIHNCEKLDDQSLLVNFQPLVIKCHPNSFNSKPGFVQTDVLGVNDNEIHPLLQVSPSNRQIYVKENVTVKCLLDFQTPRSQFPNLFALKSGSKDHLHSKITRARMTDRRVEIIIEYNFTATLENSNTTFICEGIDKKSHADRKTSKTLIFSQQIPKVEGRKVANRTFRTLGHTSSQDGSLQFFRVPRSGCYKIIAKGASGGNCQSKIGGFGAKVVAQFNLLKNDDFTVVVGKSGMDTNSSNDSGGGGGGASMVYKNSDLITIAGGGGGAAHDKDGISGKLNRSSNSTGCQCMKYICGYGAGWQSHVFVQPFVMVSGLVHASTHNWFGGSNDQETNYGGFGGGGVGVYLSSPLLTMGNFSVGGGGGGFVGGEAIGCHDDKDKSFSEGGSSYCKRAFFCDIIEGGNRERDGEVIIEYLKSVC